MAVLKVQVVVVVIDTVVVTDAPTNIHDKEHPALYHMKTVHCYD